MDVTRYDGILIQKGKKYLVAVRNNGKQTLKWSTSPWDGVLIEKLSDAQRVAKKVGGKIVRFNPVTGVISLVR